MLKTLSIWNFALIEHIQIEFDRGLNILTGETGAGKSILLGALGMVIGRRTNTDAIRSGADFMRVEGVFSLEEQRVRDFLMENNILTEDDMLIVTRQISAGGRNIIQINNCHTTLAVLRQLGEMLVDIHGQHANQALLKPAKQLNLVDEYDAASINEQKQNYLQIYHRWQNLREKLVKSKINTQEMAQRTDMLNWQINEIQNAKLTVGEDSELDEAIKILANAEKISLLSQNAYNLLYEDGNILGSMAQLCKDTEALSQYDENMARVHQIIEDAYFQLQDGADEIRSFGENIDYSPQKLDAMQSRMEEINKLRRKYGASIEDILAYCEKAKAELDYIENYDANLAQMEQKLSTITEELKQSAATLHKMRQQNAVALAENIIRELQSLSMPDAKMQINLILSDNFTENGADEIEFLFSANLGEDLKTLQKIVSGGELSRIALAVKTITAQKDDANLMVFDEVDIGVGGKTAQMMAEKIARIALTRQVICITHLPQIAAMADAHFYIHKETKDNKTFTAIEEIDYGARLAEIARMASGTELTQASLENAEEMLNNARQKKRLLSM
ncbi:MAG TPA: DNA repair protein RecN [Megamonas hypermegale]|uniref:DNA repair protein RecN n=1 Tax=Megamonas hypermegale TaxID=158847 RepID=A0A921HP10_9FIRM|nr:DNA repair protein RecN [Megamonas hypermegale]MDM8142792.1 DNA repair protein RecN [Megamonas hypermegale]HJF84918.1 DNA repair protein RecN [Megamonas hypermegale]